MFASPASLTTSGTFLSLAQSGQRKKLFLVITCAVLGLWMGMLLMLSSPQRMGLDMVSSYSLFCWESTDSTRVTTTQRLSLSPSLLKATSLTVQRSSSPLATQDSSMSLPPSSPILLTSMKNPPLTAHATPPPPVASAGIPPFNPFRLVDACPQAPPCRPRSSLPPTTEDVRALLNATRIREYNTVVTVTDAHLDFVRNFQAGFNCVMPPEYRDHFLVVAADEKTLSALRDCSIPAISGAAIFPSMRGLDGEGEGVYGTLRYQQFANDRNEIVLRLLKDYNATILSTDADVVFTSDAIYEYLDKVLGSGDDEMEMAFQRDETFKERVHLRLCKGFYIVKPTPLVIDIFKKTLNHRDRPKLSDQPIFNQVFRELPKEKRSRAVLLDPLLFPNGGFA